MFQLRKLPLPLPVRVRQLPAVRLMAVYQPTGTADAAVSCQKVLPGNGAKQEKAALGCE